jgi:hypothetical protein
MRALRLSILLLPALSACGARTELGVPVGDAEPTGCPGVPSAATRIATLDVADYEEPATLVVVGPYAYIGLWDGSSGGEIVRVPLAGGSTEIVATTYDFSPLVADADSLYFSPATAIGALSSHTQVTALDLTTSAQKNMPMPSAPSGQYFVSGIVASGPPAGLGTGLFWLDSAETPTGDSEISLLVSSNGTEATVLSSLPLFGSDFVLGTTDAFVLGGTAINEGFQDEGLYRAPLSGAAPTQLKSFITYESPMLIGTAGNDVIYTPDGVSIIRSDGVTDHTLVSQAYVEHCGSSIPFCQHRGVWVDDKWVYYIANASIMRVDLEGKANETFVTDMTTPPAEVTSDTCSVYWIATDPTAVNRPSLYVKRR